MPFDKEGVKSEKMYLVKNGILENVILDTYYAKILNKESNFRIKWNNFDTEDMIKVNNEVRKILKFIL